MDPRFLSYVEPFDPSKLPGPKGADPVHRRALEAAVAGADAYRLTRAAVRREGPTLRVGNRFVPIERYREIAFVALGRAAISQALAVHHTLDQRLTQGYALSPETLPTEIPFRDRVLPSTGPGNPSAAEGGAAVLELAEGLGPNDLLLVLLSAGALGYLAAPPKGVGADAWRDELGALGPAGATAEEVDLIARIEGTGPIGGRLGPGVKAEVATLVIDRGEGAAILGGGPTVPVDPAERTRARAVLERVGAWAGLSEARRAPFSASGAVVPRPPRVDRPVLIAEPADALREASGAVAERRWLPRLADLRNALPPEAAAEHFLDRTEQILRDLEGDPAWNDATGLVVFGPMSLDVPEGADEGPAIDRFLTRALRLLRRRETTVGAARTSGAPPGAQRPAGGVVGPGSESSRPTARSLPMRAGITDVGVLATAVVPRTKPS